MPTTLSIQECLSFGWRTFKARPWFFIGAFFLVFIVSWATNFPHDVYKQVPPGGTDLIAYVALSALSMACSFLISMGEYHFSLRAHDDTANVTLRDLLYFRPFWKYVGVSLLLVVILIPAFLLLIVPGVILALMFLFSGLIVLDRGLGPIEALKESARITKGNRWRLFLFVLAMVGVNLLGLLALVVGLLVSVPVTTLALVHAYRALAKDAAQPSMPLPEPASAVPAA